MVDVADIDGARFVLIAFGTELREMREQQGLSLRELEPIIGIGYVDLSRIEKGRLCPSYAEAQIIRDWVLQHSQPTVEPLDS